MVRKGTKLPTILMGVLGLRRRGKKLISLKAS